MWLISKWGLCKQNQLKWGHIWIRMDSTSTDWYLYERETHGEAMWWMRQRREGMCLQTKTLGHCQHPPEAGRETGGRFTSTFLRTQPWGKPESVGVRIQYTFLSLEGQLEGSSPAQTSVFLSLSCWPFILGSAETEEGCHLKPAPNETG